MHNMQNRFLHINMINFILFGKRFQRLHSECAGFYIIHCLRFFHNEFQLQLLFVFGSDADLH